LPWKGSPGAFAVPDKHDFVKSVALCPKELTPETEKMYSHSDITGNGELSLCVIQAGISEFSPQFWREI
jgi:hypothetical protein